MPQNKTSTSATSDPAQAFGAAFGEALKSWADLSLPFEQMSQMQNRYLEQMSQIWQQALIPAAPEVKKPIPDRRFSAPAWQTNPLTALMAQTYLLNAQTLLQMADSFEGDAKTKSRIRFAVQQWVDAMSPANFLALNPEAQEKAIQTQGRSIAAGIEQMLHDLRQGHVSQTDESVFEVGRNVATTQGAVVFENELMQIIEYKPLTAKIHAVPMLFVPPCINKFYILDLQPENSLIRYTVEQGHRVFVLSWRNPDEALAHKNWSDYIEQGPIQAIEVVQQISGSKTVNMKGFCVGGTLLMSALAVLAARGQHPAASVTLLTTLLDFTDTGILDIFIDEAAVQLREITIGDKAPAGPQLLKGQELANTFNLLRPNDLVWNYVVGNYLKGEKPPAFDLLYWNSDSTNLPGPMYAWYLRHLYLQNELCVPGKLQICGEKIDLASIKAPVYLYGSREDHIVPWESAYRSVGLLKGDKRFVLGASGHIAGVINPPAKGKRCYWVNDQLADTPQDWLVDAQERPGSWWTDWTQWLKPRAGALVNAPKTMGSRTHKPIEPAPGRYVKAKA